MIKIHNFLIPKSVQPMLLYVNLEISKHKLCFIPKFKISKVYANIVDKKQGLEKKGFVIIAHLLSSISIPCHFSAGCDVESNQVAEEGERERAFQRGGGGRFPSPHTSYNPEKGIPFLMLIGMRINCAYFNGQWRHTLYDIRLCCFYEK